VRSAEDKHYLLVGRISSLGITLLGAWYAVFLVSRVLYSFLLTESLATFLGISLLGGIIWPRANRWGAMASLVVSVGVNFTLYFVRGQRLDQWEPGVFLTALVSGIVALVVVSLLTQSEPDSAVRSFFGNLQTSSDGDISVFPAGAGLPVNAPRMDTAASGQQLLVVNLLHLKRGAASNGFFSAYREDLSGFVLGSDLAIGMVVLVWLLFGYM
jgi:hypothetical protein